MYNYYLYGVWVTNFNAMSVARKMRAQVVCACAFFFQHKKMCACACLFCLCFGPKKKLKHFFARHVVVVTLLVRGQGRGDRDLC